MADLRLRRDVVWNLVPVALLAVVGLGLNFALASWWGPEALGVFNLVTIALFVSAVIGAFGLQYAVLRAVAAARGRDEIPAIVVGALVPNVVLAAAATGGFLLLRAPLARLFGSDAVATGMTWAAPALFCFAINKVLLGVVNGLRRMRAFAIYTSLRYVAIAGGLGLVRALDVAGDHLAVIWSISEGLLFVVLVGELVATVPLARGAGWLRRAREHLAYGARGVTATLAYEINSKLDVWMVGVAGLGPRLVGIYSVAAALNEGAGQLAVVVQNNLNPLLARDLAAGRIADVEALVRRTRRWFVPVLAGACIAGAALYPVVVPALIGNPQFAAGALPFAILMAGMVIGSPYLPFAQVLLMANRPWQHAILVLLGVSLNFTCDLVLIPRHGLVGAAGATALAVVGSALLVRGLARLHVGVRL